VELNLSKFDKKTIERIACKYVSPTEPIQLISCSNQTLEDKFKDIICKCIQDLVSLIRDHLLEYIDFGISWIKENLYPTIQDFLNNTFSFLIYDFTEEYFEQVVGMVLDEITSYLDQAKEVILKELNELVLTIEKLICQDLLTLRDLGKIKSMPVSPKKKLNSSFF